MPPGVLERPLVRKLDEEIQRTEKGSTKLILGIARDVINQSIEKDSLDDNVLSDWHQKIKDCIAEENLENIPLALDSQAKPYLGLILSEVREGDARCSAYYSEKVDLDTQLDLLQCTLAAEDWYTSLMFLSHVMLIRSDCIEALKGLEEEHSTSDSQQKFSTEMKQGESPLPATSAKLKEKEEVIEKLIEYLETKYDSMAKEVSAKTQDIQKAEDDIKTARDNLRKAVAAELKASQQHASAYGPVMWRDNVKQSLVTYGTAYASRKHALQSFIQGSTGRNSSTT